MGVLTPSHEAMSRGVLSNPSLIGYGKGPLMKKANPKHTRGYGKRPMIKKESTPNTQGAKKKTSDKKRGNPKHARG
jgi:hypothetical protein